MITFSEIIERALRGPICAERDFELRIFVPNLRKVIEKHKIKYDPNNPVPADDDLADRVWEAGIEFLVETGLYCVDTERRIMFSREEVEGAVTYTPGGRVFGEDKDARTVPLRKPEDETPPFCSVGPTSAPVSNEWIYLQAVKAHAISPFTDAVTIPCLTVVDGRSIVANSPLGVEGAIRAVWLTREAMRRAGRPGMAIVNGVTTAARAQEHIAASQFGIRKSDALEIGTIHEMKIDFDSLNKIAYCLSAGISIFGENGIIIGGLAGGPAGVAVVGAAYNPVDVLVLKATVQHPFPTHFDLITSSLRESIWARSVLNQAVTRHSTLPVVNIGYSAAGGMTKMLFYEHSAWCIASVASGGSIEVGSAAKGVGLDYVGPLEACFASEMAHAVVGKSRQEVNKIVQYLLGKYEDKIKTPEPGKIFPECFDLDSCTPKKEYLKIQREVRKEMTGKCGLQFTGASPYI